MIPGMSLLRELAIPMSAEYETRESLIRTLKKANVTETDTLDDYAHINEDGTVTQKSTRISFHSSLTIFSEEFTVFLGYNNPQLMSDLSNWYDCGPRWQYRTKNAGTDDITGVFVNLIGATTPDLIQSALPIDSIGGGLTSRIIFVFADTLEKVVPFPFPTEDEKAQRKILFSDLEQIHGMRGEFHLDEGAMKFWEKWYTVNHHEKPFKDSRFSGYVSRRPQHILKMSMIISASLSADFSITKEILGESISFLKETEIPMPRTFAGLGRSEQAQTIASMQDTIRRAESISEAELIKAYQLDANIREIDSMLLAMSRMKLIRMVEEVEGRMIYWVGK